MKTARIRANPEFSTWTPTSATRWWSRAFEVSKVIKGLSNRRKPDASSAWSSISAPRRLRKSIRALWLRCPPPRPPSSWSTSSRKLSITGGRQNRKAWSNRRRMPLCFKSPNSPTTKSWNVNAAQLIKVRQRSSRRSSSRRREKERSFAHFSKVTVNLSWTWITSKGANWHKLTIIWR